MSFRDRAKAHVSGSTILEGKTKIGTDEIIARFPNGVTITDFDFLEGRNGSYVVCTLEEAPGYYFAGGLVLTSIFKDFVTDYDSLKACRVEFVKEKLKVKLSHGRTKSGNNITLVDII